MYQHNYFNTTPPCIIPKVFVSLKRFLTRFFEMVADRKKSHIDTLVSVKTEFSLCSGCDLGPLFKGL